MTGLVLRLIRRGVAGLALGGVILLGVGCAGREPKPNLGLYKEQLIAWQDSGAYAACFARAAAQGLRIVQREVRAARPGERLAIVLDIDETALSNWGYLSRGGFDVQADTFRQWVERHNDPAWLPTLAVYREARSAGVAVFLISGRREALREATVRQLRTAGYEGWAGLHLCPDSYDQKSIVPFKSGVRQKLAEEGWRIILNMGDQWSDLEGGPAAPSVKLPNPFYFIR